jgi:hypothetical protein
MLWFAAFAEILAFSFRQRRNPPAKARKPLNYQGFPNLFFAGGFLDGFMTWV